MDLEQAYQEAGPKIVGYLVATGAAEATARDLLHDAVVRVERRLEDRGQGAADNLPALLFAAARNLRRNLLRDDARLTFVDEVRDDDCAASGEGAEAPTSPSVDADYLRRRLKAAFARLPDALRETYTLYQVGERSVREVAEMTGASENLVKVRLHRAKAALRRTLGDLTTGKPGHMPT